MQLDGQRANFELIISKLETEKQQSEEAQTDEIKQLRSSLSNILEQEEEVKKEIWEQN